nr:reverse transcriptase domain-containing protein [Tanacetum cinerariifolium]
MNTSRKTVRASFIIPPAIKVAITKEIAVPPHKRCRSPSPPPLPSSSSSPSPPPAMLPPHKRFRMTSPHQDTTAVAMTEAINPARLRQMLAAWRWMCVPPRIYAWRDEEGSPKNANNKARSRFCRHSIIDSSVYADLMTAYEAIQNNRNGVNKETSGSARGVEHTELALLCPTMVKPEYKKSERYIWGLTNNIQRNATSSKPKKIHEAMCMTHDRMDQVVRSKAAKGRDNKMK